MCSDVTGVISCFKLRLVVSSWPCAHGNWAVTSTGHHKNSSGDFGWGIASPLAHLGRCSHISIPSFPIFMTCTRKILTPETASLLACLAQSSMVRYCIEKHITAEQFELGSWVCRYCNFNSPLNSSVPVQWAVVLLKRVWGNISLKMLCVLKLWGVKQRSGWCDFTYSILLKL